VRRSLESSGKEKKTTNFKLFADSRRGGISSLKAGRRIRIKTDLGRGVKGIMFEKIKGPGEKKN